MVKRWRNSSQGISVKPAKINNSLTSQWLRGGVQTSADFASSLSLDSKGEVLTRSPE